MIDAAINFSEISPKLIRLLQQFEPFGPENMTPTFVSKNVIDTGYAKTMGQKDEHLKLFVKQNDSEGIPAIGFNLGKNLEITKNRKPFDIVFSINENEFNGKIDLQLQLKDLKS